MECHKMNFLSGLNLEKSLLFSDFLKSRILKYQGFLLEMKVQSPF